MARDTAFVSHVLDLLSGWPGVTAKRMFSGHGLFRGGRMFGIVIDDRLYLKTDERNRASYVDAGMGPFTYGRANKRVSMSYMEAPPDLLDDGEEMKRWAMTAFAVALAKAAAEKAPKRAKRPPTRTKKRPKKRPR